jgi:hypothetical protein
LVVADVNNLQAIVGRGSAKARFAILLFSIEDAGRAKEFLRTWKSDIPSGLAQEPDGVAALHFLFSWSALERLLRGNANLDVSDGQRAFEAFFVDPLQAPDRPAVAKQFGFVGDSAPANWWHGFKTGDIELAVYGAFDSDQQRDDYVGRLRASAAACGLRERRLPSFANGALSGYRAPRGIVHFGYRDGISPFDVDWSDSGQPGLIDLRQLIVGYPNADFPTLPFQPGAWRDFSREGSYACLTWLGQDVAGFETYLAQQASVVAPMAGNANPKEWLAAKLLGRWRDGTPLALYHTQQPNPPVLSNAFGYVDDPKGFKCPVTAHIRVANSRDQPLKFANEVRFPKGPPRLARRGFSYGEPWQASADANEPRGIVGLFLCASVNEQFYTILRWIHQTDFSDVYRSFPNGTNAQDALVGDHAAAGANTSLHLMSERTNPADIGLKPFVSYKGVVVLFAPGMHALEILSRD